MEAARSCWGANALFLVILLGSIAGHLSLIWLQPATAIEPQMAELESGRSSIAIHMIAQPAPQPDPPEAIEPLPAEEPHPNFDPPLPAPEMSLPRRVQPLEAIQADPAIDGWEPPAAAEPPPLTRQEHTPAVPPEAQVAPLPPRPLERRPIRQTVSSVDASVEVPETLISEQATGSEVPPAFVSRPLPAYPEQLLLRRIEGVVQLLVTIDASGRVAALRVHASSGYAEMDDSALRSVRNWTFTPARRGDLPVEKTVLVPVRFTIRNQGN